MKLQQGQIWKKGNEYFRIVEWARLSIVYKQMSDLESREGPLQTATLGDGATAHAVVGSPCGANYVRITAVALAMAAVPAFLVYQEPDFGSATSASLMALSKRESSLLAR